VSTPAPDAEWLEADASGGFASGTVAGYRTRRYHALLLVARQPPGDRVVLVNGFEAWIESPAGDFPLSTQRYAPDVMHPRGLDRLVGFTGEPWPTWTFLGPSGMEVVHECIVDRVDGSVLLAWRLTGKAAPARLQVRPLLSGRGYHSLMRENADFDFSAKIGAATVSWRTYAEMPAITALSNGDYEHRPAWYRNFLYSEEAARGLDHIEDLGSPGIFSFDLKRRAAFIVLRAGDLDAADAAAEAKLVRRRETARRKSLTPIDRAADSYIVQRGGGHTIIAGFPWFTDWGRDTFIAMRGLCIERRQYGIAASILLEWATTVSAGMLPNRFPDHGQAPEYNAVDASLWYVIAVHEFLAAARPGAGVRDTLLDTVRTILDGYAAGTRYGIRMDGDGLLACGVPGGPLTWMDAKFGDHVVTPRIGKPVEVQALWINALRCMGGPYELVARRAQVAFRDRFWNAAANCLYDVVDVDHRSGDIDASIRPNQIIAVGGLPYQLVDDDLAAAVVMTVERELLTPMGLRSLSPRDSSYHPKYEGGPAERDGAYHQGTVWPWLIGAFVDAWLRVNGDDAAHRSEARQRFLAPLEAHLDRAGLGHISEIADGDLPHAPRGCPFQAWSLGELMRAHARTAPGPASADRIF
jgi:predicted glycogen debranching enzyme